MRSRLLCLQQKKPFVEEANAPWSRILCRKRPKNLSIDIISQGPGNLGSFEAVFPEDERELVLASIGSHFLPNLFVPVVNSLQPISSAGCPRTFGWDSTITDLTAVIWWRRGPGAGTYNMRLRVAFRRANRGSDQASWAEVLIQRKKGSARKFHSLSWGNKSDVGFLSCI